MAFKPANSGGNGGSGDREYTNSNLPVPKSGSRKARVSLIVDLGIQNREDKEDEKTKEMKPQNPAHQIAVFADLVNDVVDYGGEIGLRQYRLPLNNIFKGVIEGINFNTVPPTDADGNRIEGKPWGLHPRSKLTILAKAVDKEEVTYEGTHPEAMDISLLLNQPFMAQVEVKETPAKDKSTGAPKKDKEGKPIIYKNVNYRGAAPIPTIEDDQGNETPMPVAALRQKPLCITFSDAKESDIQFIRPSLIKMIKQANNYAGSQMQKAIEAYEAKNGGDAADDGQKEQAQEPAQKAASKPAAKPKAQAKAKPAAAPAGPVDDMDDDIPF